MTTWYKLYLNASDFCLVNYYFKTDAGAGKQTITGMYNNPSENINILIEGDNWYDNLDGNIELNFKSYKNAFHGHSEGDEFKISGSIFSGHRVDSLSTGVEINMSGIMFGVITDPPCFKE